MTIEFYNQWQFRKVNWIDFTIINLRFERDYVCNVFEITFGLFGFNCMITKSLNKDND